MSILEEKKKKRRNEKKKQRNRLCQYMKIAQDLQCDQHNYSNENRKERAL